MKLHTRKIIAACLVVLGVIILLLAPTHTTSGIVLVVIGIAIEVVGITLEKRRS
jgi:drug/metabolite transporter (DMT)-like permease